MPDLRVLSRGFLIVVTLALATALTGCGLLSGSGGSADGPVEESDGSAGQDDSTTTDGFDLDAIEVVDGPEGGFPYFEIPSGYANPNADIPVDEYGRVPFWTGDRLEWVEGTVYRSIIHAAEGQNFSSIELKKLVGDAIDAAGGVLVTDSAIPADALAEIDDETIQTYLDGFGDIWNHPVQTYVVRTAESVVWVHLCATSAGAGWLIVETPVAG